MSRHSLHFCVVSSAALVAFILSGDADAQYSPSNFTEPSPYARPGAAALPAPAQPFQSAPNAYGTAPAGVQQPSYPASFAPPTGRGPAPPGMQPYPPNQNQNVQGMPQQDLSQLSYLNGPPANQAMQTAPAVPACPHCDDGSCMSCRGVPGDIAEGQAGSRIGFEAVQLFDTFRGPPEGSGPSNFGEVTRANAGVPVIEAWGIGWQLGASYGIYDFSGRPRPATETSGAQQQVFVTTGFFRCAKEGQRASFGLVHDWMINNNYSQYAVSPTISQWRGQFEWALSGRNSFGVWGTWHDKSFIRDVPDNHNQFRAISQINAFWHHKYEFGADTWLRVGLPVSKELVGNALAGSAIIGATAQVPLNHQLALYANAMYMAPNTSAGPIGSARDAYNVSMGIAWYPGRNARTPTVNGARWLPYMPLGNNTNFLVDSSHFD
ncbi:MAG TPA: hypothetical protein PK867_11105 [Pirellulales bacterium]|nr:hypothetical protein [Pirellulales bacterium]